MTIHCCMHGNLATGWETSAHFVGELDDPSGSECAIGGSEADWIHGQFNTCGCFHNHPKPVEQG